MTLENNIQCALGSVKNEPCHGSYGKNYIGICFNFDMLKDMVDASKVLF